MNFKSKRALKHLKDTRLSIHKRVEYAIRELEAFHNELLKAPPMVWIKGKAYVEVKEILAE